MVSDVDNEGVYTSVGARDIKKFFLSSSPFC